MRTFLTDRNNDLVISDGNLTALSGLDAVISASKHYAQTLHGEMIHDMTNGIRMFDTAFNRPRLALFANEIRRRIMQVPDVIAVTRLDARVSQGTLFYDAWISTQYGTGQVSNFESEGSISGGGDSVGKCDGKSTLFGFYIEDGDLIFYTQDDLGVQPKIYIDDDGHLIFYTRDELGVQSKMYIDDDGYLIEDDLGAQQKTYIDDDGYFR